MAEHTTATEETFETRAEREKHLAQAVHTYVEAWQHSHGNGRAVPDAIEARILKLLNAT